MAQSGSMALSGRPSGKGFYRWILGLLVVVVLVAGWFYPYLGFAVPVVMVTGMAGGLVNGRWACGNLCPRGSFFDTWFGLAGFRRKIPEAFFRGWVRWPALGLLMGLMVFQVLQDPRNPEHWGRVFWNMCLVTTMVGLGLGILYRGRAWCTICPVGTVAATLGGSKASLAIDRACKQCGVCEKTCPMGHAIAAYRELGSLPHADCLRCSSCLEACPREALFWPGRASGTAG